MFLKKHYLVLAAVLILAAVLRFYNLGRVPPSPDWDEASLAWNAYSIIQTGKDEYGQTLPLILRSFDDYKPAAYMYLAIPGVALFGLNTFAIRFPAALLGTFSVFVVYLLIRELFLFAPIRSTPGVGGRKFDPTPRNFGGIHPGGKSSPLLTSHLPLVTSFLLAISPWHLQFSRIAFETNVGLLVNLLTALFFLKGLKKPGWLLVAAFLAGVNIYVYQAEKVFTPLLVLGLALIYFRRLLAIPKKYLGGAVLIGLLTLAPFGLIAARTPEVFLRAKGTSFAADQTSFLLENSRRLARDREAGDFLGLVFDNRRVTYLMTFTRNYFSHLDLNWLFLKGDEARHHAPGMGLLYLWELPFLLWGVYAFVFSRAPRPGKLFLLFWLVIAPIPASFSSGAPHAVRSLRILPIPQILVAFGLLAAWQWLKGLPVKAQRSLLALSLLFISFNFSYFLSQYFVQQNYFHSEFWQYGYQEAVGYVNKIAPEYQKVVVSNEPHLDQSYMFFLFYLGYDPRSYQTAGGTVSGGFAESHRGFDRYTFRPIDWDKEERAGVLFVGRPQDFPDNARILKTFNFINGKPALVIAEG